MYIWCSVGWSPPPRDGVGVSWFPPPVVCGGSPPPPVVMVLPPPPVVWCGIYRVYIGYI